MRDREKEGETVSEWEPMAMNEKECAREWHWQDGKEKDNGVECEKKRESYIEKTEEKKR